MAEDTSVELARWLQEAGRRRYSGGASRERIVFVAPQPRKPQAGRFDRVFLKNAVLLVSGALAAIQYAYADTMVQILSLHSVIVFLFIGT